MIASSHKVICDGCGCAGPTSNHSAAHAQTRALGNGWTTDSPGLSVVGKKHWCPACTEARKES